MSVVSIVVPCYNQGHFLGETLASALAQVGADLDVIVVDDGSTDSTPEVAAAARGVRYVRQDNAGLPAARNTGLRESKGDTVVFLDSDDRLLPGAVAAGLAALARAPEAAFAYGAHVNIDRDGGRLPPSPVVPLGDDPYATLLTINCVVNPAAAIYRRWVFDRVGGFDTRLRASEDYDLYLRIAREFAVVAHPAIVVEYRRHGAAMSADPARMLVNTLRVLRAQRRRAALTPAHRAAWREGMRTWADCYGRPLAWRAGRRFTQGQWRAGARDAATIAWHAPGLVARVLAGRARRRWPPAPGLPA
jgi:glycosyltransferase involved in cell wall biosynthesis